MAAVGCSTRCSEGLDLSSENIDVSSWDEDDVLKWAKEERLTHRVSNCLKSECIDGCVLLELTEDDIRDFRYRLYHNDLTFSDMKKLWLSVKALQKRFSPAVNAADTLNVLECGVGTVTRPPPFEEVATADASPLHRRNCPLSSPVPTMNACGRPLALTTNNDGYAGMCCMVANGSGGECDNMSPPMSVDGRATHIPPEFFKTAISLGYSFLVTWITSFVMVIVHERVPDMKRYPPLPDIFLDNVPHIPWAFHMCEITGTLLFSIWCCVCVFHKYRMVLLRRFFALAGTVFLLRCVTMLITSLSVPGTHLQCNHNDYAVDDTELSVAEAIELRISRAYTIWSGLGMSIQGVRTCGDYMFSGHTVALTLLNFFITEYTPRNLYFLHTVTWILNMFGIFFILAAHEHYSIDVFVAFYITSRLFLYYHTLANNQALMSHDSNRTRIWFPMFSYFESSVDGIIPNEYDSFGTLLENLIHFILSIKDSCMLTARRYWIDPPNLQMISKNVLCAPSATTTPMAIPTTANTKQNSSISSPTNASVYNTTTSMSSSMACSVDDSEDSRQNLLRRKQGLTALNE